jgi:hypothetical protein
MTIRASFVASLTHFASDIDVPFQVPFEGAVSTEIFSSGMSWIEFRSTLADLLSLAPSAVKVAYRFSVQPRSTQHTHLRNADDLISLFEKARAAQVKHGKSKSSKEFFVELKDLEPSVNAKQKGKKKDTKKKKVLSSFQWLKFELMNQIARRER